jgi:hypothetical protein
MGWAVADILAVVGFIQQGRKRMPDNKQPLLWPKLLLAKSRETPWKGAYTLTDIQRLLWKR